MTTLRKKAFQVINITLCVLCVQCSFQEKNIEDEENQNIAEVEYTLGKSLFPNDYSGIEGLHPKDGFVSTPEMAVQIAAIVLNEIYGKRNIDDQKPFFVTLNNDVWIVEGRMDADPNNKGGVAYIEILKSDGRILKVAHGK